MSTTKYSNSKIYRLTNTIDEMFYIGSTGGTLEARLAKHKFQIKKTDENSNNKLYTHLKRIGAENVRIELIRNFTLQNKEELLKIENNFIESFKTDDNCLNTLRSFLDEEQRKYIENEQERIIEAKNHESLRLHNDMNNQQHRNESNTYNKEHCIHIYSGLQWSQNVYCALLKRCVLC